MDRVGKDAFDIHTRLFDHRPFLNGELRAFVKDFEEKRGDSDLKALIKDQQILSELNSIPTEDIRKTLINDVGSLVQSLKATNLEISSVHSTENSEVPEFAAFLEKQRILRQKEWDKILDGSTTQMSTLDNLVREKELKYRQYYETLEENLKLN